MNGKKMSNATVFNEDLRIENNNDNITGWSND